MASGSNAPFSGEFVDLENVPKLPEGISAEQVLEQNSDVVRQVAEARHKAGLSQVNADGGFFDAYVDGSKISTSSKIGELTGVPGKVRLSKIFTESYKDGNMSNYTFFGDSDSSNTFASSTNPIQGDFSAVLDANSEDLSVEKDITPVSPSSFSFKFRLDNLSNNQNDIIRIDLGSQNDDIALAFKLKGTGKIESGAFVDTGENFNKVGETVLIEFRNIDFNNNNFDLFIDGSKIGNFDFFRDVNQIGKIFIKNQTAFDGGDMKLKVDAFTNSTDGVESSGSLTEQQFTFTDTQGNAFSPSKIGIFPDQTLNGQNITYDLKDSSGNVVKTFQQSDLNQLQSVSTSDDTFQIEANFSGDGTQTPELEFLDVRGV